MASTATTNIGFSKPAKKDPDWDIEVNSNSDLLDDLFSETVSKSVAGGSTVTLTTAEAHAAVLILTGALTADIDLVLPHSGYYRIQNNTTGAYNVTAKNAAYGSDAGSVLQKGNTTLLLCQAAVNTSELGIRPVHMGGAISGSTADFLSAGLTFTKGTTGTYLFTFDDPMPNTYYGVHAHATGSLPWTVYAYPLKSTTSFTIYGRDRATGSVPTDFSFEFTVSRWIGA